MNTLRERQQRNFLATLFLSQGVPMLLGGDEISRTQRGNNNAYCQDNELSWYDWNLDAAARRMLSFTQFLIRLRREHPVFRRRQWFRGHQDADWLSADGTPMTPQDWDTGYLPALTMFLNGQGIPSVDARGRPISDDSFLICMNASHKDVDFTLPPAQYGRRWQLVMSTARPEARAGPARHPAGDELLVVSRSLVLLRRLDDARDA